MYYLLQPNRAIAHARSAAIARALNCGLRPGDVTKEWFGVVEHPVTGQAALEIPDGGQLPYRLKRKGEAERMVATLTTTERGQLVERAALERGGWFPVEREIDTAEVERIAPAPAPAPARFFTPLRLWLWALAALAGTTLGVVVYGVARMLGWL